MTKSGNAAEKNNNNNKKQFRAKTTLFEEFARKMARKTKKSPEKRQLTLSSMLKRKRGTGQLDTEELDHFLNSQTLAENENQTITIQSENEENELNLEPTTSHEADEQTIAEKRDEIFDDNITDPDFQPRISDDDDESELETADESEKDDDDNEVSSFIRSKRKLWPILHCTVW